MRKEIQPSEGIIAAIYGAYYDILPLPKLNPRIRGVLRGRLRMQKKERGRLRHPIMIGDRVLFHNIPSVTEPSAAIESALPRHNVLYRDSGLQAQGLGANLDRALLIVSAASPEPNFRFVDRFLGACSTDDVKPFLLFSKIDLLCEDENRETKESMFNLYEQLGFACFRLNLTAKEPADEFARLSSLLDRGTSLFAGRSGAGKSTLLNALQDRIVQETATVSSGSGKGKHTTTNSYLVPNASGEGFYIDTPGVREWGVRHLNRRQIVDSFPELRSLATECPFSNCEHRPEDEVCHIWQAVRAAGYVQKIERSPIDNRSLLVFREATQSIDQMHPDSRFIHPARLSSLMNMLQTLDDTPGQRPRRKG